jgi:hypothetical protein
VWASPIPLCYALAGQGTSEDFCAAFAKGCGGRVVRTKELLDGDVFMFGQPDLWPILMAAKEQGRNWYYGDKAYWGRAKYWRVTKNAMQHDCLGDAKPNRFERLGIKIKPWQSGSHIMLCPQSDTFFRFFGTTQKDWIEKTTETLRQYTDRPIIIRTKTGANPEQDFRNMLHKIHAVVVFTSMAGMQAAIYGVPCFATADCVSARFGTMDLSRIESPAKPDNREQMAWVLADNQWTYNEISRGMAWEKLSGMG